MPRPPPSGPALEELLTRKEAEWRALQAHRTQLQGAALKEAQRQLEEAQGQLRRLREDFVYNLQVLEERDLELDRYDLAFAQARRQEEARQAEASELKIEVTKLRQALDREVRQTEELQQRQRLTLQEHRLELERLHSDKNGEIHHLREQYEQLQGTLGRKLQELDGELALQKQELLLEFESELQRRGHESRLQADTLSNAVLTHELKVKLLRKELEALKGAAAEAAESQQRAEAAIAELEHTVARRDQELQDLEAVKDARIKDLEGKLHAAQLMRAKDEETFRRKHEELDRLARERDAVLASVREAHAEQLRALETRERELQAHRESLETRLRRAEWEQADAARDHDTAITRLREEASALKSGWDAQVAQLSKEMVSKDLQVHALQEEGLRLTAQSARLQQDINRYKQQLAAAMGREQSLEREKVQLELDWKHRCDSAERDQYRRSEELIQGLTTAREQVAAKLQETEQRLSATEELLKALTLERDQAVLTLRTHGLLPKQKAQTLLEHHKEETSQDFPSSEIQRLQEQNISLRNVVTQMRREMEALSDPVTLPANLGGQISATNQTDLNTTADTTTPDYVLVLKEEIRSLKHKFKTLEEQLQDALDPPKMSSCSAEAQPGTGDRPQAEVAPSVLACRKLAGRVRLLDHLLSRLRQKVLQKPPEMDAVRLQLPREVDQVHMEVSELGRQVAELDKHLSTTQKDGGEAKDGTQPQTLETTAPWRQHPAELRLQTQLRAAAKSILRLRQQNEQLTEAGNRLRARLGRQGTSSCLSHLPAPGQEPESPPDGGLPLGQEQPRFTVQSVSRIPTTTCKSARQKENRSPKPPQAQVLQEADPRTQRSPSVASSSLQDTWKLLELGSSPSDPASQENSTPEHPAPTAAGSLVGPLSHATIQGKVVIEGKKVEAQPKPTRTPRSPAKRRHHAGPPRIRNYNLKD